MLQPLTMCQMALAVTVTWFLTTAWRPITEVATKSSKKVCALAIKPRWWTLDKPCVMIHMIRSVTGNHQLLDVKIGKFTMNSAHQLSVLASPPSVNNKAKQELGLQPMSLPKEPYQFRSPGRSKLKFCSWQTSQDKSSSLPLATFSLCFNLSLLQIKNPTTAIFAATVKLCKPRSTITHASSRAANTLSSPQHALPLSQQRML